MSLRNVCGKGNAFNLLNVSRNGELYFFLNHSYADTVMPVGLCLHQFWGISSRLNLKGQSPNLKFAVTSANVCEQEIGGPGSDTKYITLKNKIFLKFVLIFTVFSVQCRSLSAAVAAPQPKQQRNGQNIVLVDGVRTPFLTSGTTYSKLMPHELARHSLL